MFQRLPLPLFSTYNKVVGSNLAHNFSYPYHLQFLRKVLNGGEGYLIKLETRIILNWSGFAIATLQKELNNLLVKVTCVKIKERYAPSHLITSSVVRACHITIRYNR